MSAGLEEGGRDEPSRPVWRGARRPDLGSRPCAATGRSFSAIPAERAGNPSTRTAASIHSTSCPHTCGEAARREREREQPLCVGALCTVHALKIVEKRGTERAAGKLSAGWGSPAPQRAGPEGEQAWRQARTTTRRRRRRRRKRHVATQAITTQFVARACEKRWRRFCKEKNLKPCPWFKARWDRPLN